MSAVRVRGGGVLVVINDAARDVLIAAGTGEAHFTKVPDGWQTFLETDTYEHLLRVDDDPSIAILRLTSGQWGHA